MKPLSGFDLQKARRAAAERFLALGLSYVPKGYTVEYRKSLTGRHYGSRKIISAPRPVTRKSLYIFLHECAHAHLHGPGCKLPVHVKELQAEQWAHATMRRHGIPVPRVMTERARRYVARKIRRAIASGARYIDPAARNFAEGR